MLEGFWGDAGESLDAYRDVDAFVAEHGANRPRRLSSAERRGARLVRGQRDREHRLGLARRARGGPTSAMPCAVEAELGEQLVGLALGDEGPRHAEDPERTGAATPPRGSAPRDRGAEELTGPSVAEAVLDGDDDAVREGGREHRGVGRRDDAHVEDGRRRRPRPTSRSAASSAAPTSLPTARTHTVPSPSRSCRARRPSPAPTQRGGGGVFGKRIDDGPGSDSAVSSITPTSSALDGAKTVMSGIERHSARSSTPWWLGPSSPVIPARSSTVTTGRRCSPTSRLAWSKARVKKVE